VTELCEVVITAPEPDWLVEFTRQLVAERLAASGHNYTPVRSLYRWRGEVYDRLEGRVSLHTRKSLVPEIVRRAKELHPYEVPGISSRAIDDGNPDYLQWIHSETREPAS
jgi:periplasmic divalent cation tolerance protein